MNKYTKRINCIDYKNDILKLLNENKINPYIDANSFLNEIKSKRLPKDLDNIVNDFIKNIDTHVLLFENLPLDVNIKKINTLKDTLNKTTFISEYCLSIFGKTLGEIFGYIQIDNGNLFHNIIPTREMENEQSYAGSKTELMFHTEQHFHPFSPDYLLLYCLRGDKNASTFYTSVNDILNELTEDEIRVLSSTEYKTGIDHVFGNSKTEKGNGPNLPVLYKEDGIYNLRYDEDLMISTTKKSEKALNKLKKIIHNKKEEVFLKSGDLLILKNKKVVHGRSSFLAKYNGEDRWLQRMKILKNTRLVYPDYEQSSRTIKTKFNI